MAYLVGFLLNALLGAAMLWGAIKVVDRRNRRNTWGAAVFVGIYLGLVGMVPFLPGLGLIVLAYALLQYYELVILKILGVLAVLFAVNVGVFLLQQAVALS